MQAKIQRIWLHLRCACINHKKASFYMAGILREFTFV
jgi:hypothetical protein